MWNVWAFLGFIALLGAVTRFGKTMTVVVDIPGCGAQLILFQYERRDDRLKLTPVTWKGPQPEKTTTWVRQRPHSSNKAGFPHTDNQPD